MSIEINCWVRKHYGVSQHNINWSDINTTTLQISLAFFEKLTINIKQNMILLLDLWSAPQVDLW